MTQIINELHSLQNEGSVVRWTPALCCFTTSVLFYPSSLSHLIVYVCPAGAQIRDLHQAATETTMAEQSGDEAATKEVFADEDEEGWEGMEDVAPAQAAAEAAPDAAEGDDAEGWEGLESLTPAEAAAEAAPDVPVAEGDSAEGWEEPENLAPAEAAATEGDAAAEEEAQATQGEIAAAAAGEAEAAVDMHQVGAY